MATIPAFPVRPALGWGLLLVVLGSSVLSIEPAESVGSSDLAEREANPLPKPAHNRILLAWAGGKPREALTLAREALQTAPTDLVLIDQTARLFGVTGESEQGLEFLDSVLDSAARPELSEFAKASLLLERRKYTDSISTFEKLGLAFRGSSVPAENRLVYLVRYADVLKRKVRYSEAVPILEEALDLGLAGNLAHVRLEAIDLLATITSRTGELDRARALIAEGLALSEAWNDSEMEMRLTKTLAALTYALADYRAARELYRRAAEIAGELGNQRIEALRLSRVATCAVRLGEHEDALAIYEVAVAKARAAGARNEEGDIRCSVAILHEQTGDPATAVRIAEEVEVDLEAYRSEGGKIWSSVLYKAGNTKGVSLLSMGRLSEAQAAFQSTERHLKKLRPSYRESYLNNMALCLVDLGEYAEAIEIFEDILARSRERSDRTQETLALANLAQMNARRGKYQESIALFEDATRLAEQSGDEERLIRMLRHQAAVHARLGNIETAENLLSDANRLAVAGDYRTHEIACLHRLADLEISKGEFAQARGHFRAALELAKEQAAEGQVLDAMQGLARVAQVEGDLDGAETYLLQALEPGNAEIGIPRRVELLASLGQVELERGKASASQELFTEAERLSRQMGSPSASLAPLLGLARSERELGQRDRSLVYYRRAIESVESLRWGTGAEEERWNVFASHAEVYGEAAVLIAAMSDDASRHEEAFLYSEMSHARTLLDRMNEAGVDLDARVSEQLRRERRENLHRFDYVHSSLLELLSEADPYRVEVRSDSLLGELDRLDEENARIEGRIRQQISSFVELRAFDSASIEGLQRLLGPDVMLLEYVMAGDRIVLFSVSNEGLRTYTIDEGIDQEVEAFRSLIEKPRWTGEERSRYFRLANRLFEILVAPAWRPAQASIRSLVLVPDGSLWRIPFEALLTEPFIDNGVDSFESVPHLFESVHVRYTPSATTLEAIARNHPGDEEDAGSARTLVLADPDYASIEMDSVTTRRGSGAADNSAEAGLRADYSFSRLTNSRSEGMRIAELLGPDRVDLLLGSEASEDRFKSSNLSSYWGIHLAAHSHIDEYRPLRSAIVLSLDTEPSEDGFLTIREIYDLDLSADLVVLSACTTAGKGAIRGEGAIALARPFLTAGAAATVVTLWPVDDFSTRSFMGAFYSAIATGATPDSALREARRAMLSSDRRAWELPYHWAPFVLLGGL